MWREKHNGRIQLSQTPASNHVFLFVFLLKLGVTSHFGMMLLNMLHRGPSRFSLQMLADLWQRPHQSQIKAIRSPAAQVNQRTTPKNQSGTGLRDFNNYAYFDKQILSRSVLNQEADHFKTI